jgi:hypothetical protein
VGLQVRNRQVIQREDAIDQRGGISNYRAGGGAVTRWRTDDGTRW